MFRLFVIAALCLSWAHAEASPAVAVDLSRLEAEVVPDAAALEQALVMRLLQEGFAIDPLSAEPAIVVAVAGSDHELVLSAKSAHFAQSRTVDASGADEAQLQLEVVQKAVELVRLAREATPRPVAAVTAEEPVEATTARVELAPPVPRWRIGADAGVMSNTPVEASLTARYAIAGGFGAMVRASASLPDDTAAISVWEQELVAGASYERSLSRSVTAEVGLGVGVRRHHFELAMPLATRTGSRFDPALVLPARIALRVTPMIDLSLWVMAHASRERQHVSGDRELWRRDAVGVGAGAGFAVRF